MILPIFLPIGNPNINRNVPNAILCGRPFGGKLEFEIKLVGFSSFFKIYIYIFFQVCLPKLLVNQEFDMPMFFRRATARPNRMFQCSFQLWRIQPSLQQSNGKFRSQYLSSKPHELVVKLSHSNYYTQLLQCTFHDLHYCQKTIDSIQTT